MSKLLATLVRLKVRTLAFCGVRKLVELVLKYSLSDLNSSSASAHLSQCVASYRGGYTKEERRLIEGELFSGRLIGVTATCALELGVDIGDLDCTLHLGFPRSFSSLWQQAGRAGRSGRPSLSILVCHDSPVDQFFTRNPLVLFSTPSEPATLNPDNIYILRGHLLCAAKEVPLNSDLGALRDYSDDNGYSYTIKDKDLWG
jgi:DEAD/DEAH box helicase domain-containing protein